MTNYLDEVRKGYPRHIDALGLFWAPMGVAAEAGEFVGEFEKMYRKDEGHLTPERKEAILAEAGDVLWFLTAALDSLDLTVEEAIDYNIDKLRRRRGEIV